MPRQRDMLRIDGRRLRPVRLSPARSATALALVVIGFVLWIASLLTAIGALVVLALACGAVVMGILGVYVWRRLTRRGRVLFGAPVILLLVATSLAELDLPGATAVGFAGFAALVVAIAFGLVGRPGISAQYALTRAHVEPSLLRSDAPAEPLTLRLEPEGVRFGEGSDAEVWPRSEIATARLEGPERRVLRVIDRLGDEIAIEIEPAYRDEAEGLVRRLG